MFQCLRKAFAPFTPEEQNALDIGDKLEAGYVIEVEEPSDEKIIPFTPITPVPKVLDLLEGKPDEKGFPKE